MNRWTLRIILCLILGAITTVAVAWGVACSIAVQQLSDDYDAIDARQWLPDTDWFVYREERFGTTWVGSMRLRHQNEELWQSDPSPSDLVPHWVTFDPPHVLFVENAVNSEHRGAEGRGWPLRALWYETGGKLGRQTTRSSGGWIVGLPSDADDKYERALPLRPIWPGFVIDTLFYAAIWFGVFFGFASAKRAIRRARGRCPRCGYDLRRNFSGGCPECGWGRDA
jgi:hypothetical protein